MKNVLLLVLGWFSRRIIGIRFAITIANWWYGRDKKQFAVPGLLSSPETRYEIFIYHRVLPRNELFAIDVVRTCDFARQMEILANNFRVVSLLQLAEEVRCRQLKPNTVCITFDDGYHDNYKYAFPILKEKGVPATIFLATGAIGNQRQLWHDRVLKAVEMAEISQLQWKLNGKEIWNFNSTIERRRFAFSLLLEIRHKPPHLRDLEIETLLAACGIKSERHSGSEMLSWDEVKEMHQNGISFGAHTVTHPILSLIANNELDFEISNSKRMIEERIGETIQVFAYPNGQVGDYDQRAKAILQAHGFRCAVTTQRGMNCVTDDLFELRRVAGRENNINHFAARILASRMF
jgi:peptidoglycan/xylan/chitin deacetylase (PgdA/CDA1 family)